ncbi:hypothetical protein [Pectobacterium phage Zenivior_B1]|uniref:Uncharacterized protein n=2 Tax=Phimunavirus zenivior TaxID=2733345 RepID=A0A3G8FM45_9CAUD|nr:endonuclease [Pectobacterium phage Zenivior]AZF94991.1 hypothetical protein [Pectobacterium phage Zenivior]AZF95050.1 hypothetical protein [Pectobacterium phage Zenivior_B1]
MARKKQVQEATDILDNLEVQQAQEVEPVDTKLRNQVVLSLLHSASVYSISDEGVLRARVRRCMEIADIVVDELEKKND